jgi:short-subunit dehydrogenase
VDETLEHLGGIDILINAAGINPFGVYAEQDAALIQRTIEINTISPMLLVRAVLPTLLAQNSGQIVNIGSTFGSIGFAWFSAYSASKFAMRGFSQALRRELADTGIDVQYIAPRAVKTAINSQAVYDMAAAVKMNMDEPEEVARMIISKIRKRQKESYLGFPESLFVRINAVFPGLVDRAVRSQNRVAHQHAKKSG